jgi:hypothetical protein
MREKSFGVLPTAPFEYLKKEVRMVDIQVHVRTQAGKFVAVIPPAGITTEKLLGNYSGRIKTGDVCSMTIIPSKNGKGEEQFRLIKEHDLCVLAEKIDRRLEDGKTVIITLQ